MAFENEFAHLAGCELEEEGAEARESALTLGTVDPDREEVRLSLRLSLTGLHSLLQILTWVLLLL